MKVPIVYSAHHASANFSDYSDRVALSELARKKFSDYGSDTSVPRNGIATFIAQTSRALGDLNRSPDNPKLFPTHDFARPHPNKIWQDGKYLSEEEKVILKKNIHDVYHNNIIASLKEINKRVLVVAWDNTAQYDIGVNDSGKTVEMPSIILSNCGDEDRYDSENQEVSCRPETLEKLKKIFEKMLIANSIDGRVCTNLVFKGGYISEFYNTRRHREDLQTLGIAHEVESLQVEYSTVITHDQKRLKPIKGRIDLLRSIAEEAFTHLVKDWQ